MTAKFFVDTNVLVYAASNAVAVELRQHCQISYWDAAIIAAAKQMGCTAVYSEDLNPGQSYDGVTVINPFAAGTTP